MNRISTWNENRGVKVILGSAAIQDRARNTKQVCSDHSAATQVESVCHCTRDGGQEHHLWKSKNLDEKCALEKMRRKGPRGCQANGFMQKKTSKRDLQVAIPCGMDGAIGQEGKGAEDWEAELDLPSTSKGRCRVHRQPEESLQASEGSRNTPQKHRVKPISQWLFKLCRCLLNKSSLRCWCTGTVLFWHLYQTPLKGQLRNVPGVNVHSS